MNVETKFIGAAGIVEFTQKVQEAIKEGYSFDFEKNERVPQSYGNFYEAVMIRAISVPDTTKEVIVEKTVELPKVDEVVSELKEVTLDNSLVNQAATGKRGRPAKDK